MPKKRKTESEKTAPHKKHKADEGSEKEAGVPEATVDL